MPRFYHLNIYTPLRKSLRNNPTEAEDRLWEFLRKRRFKGLKFRRQESIGRYIVDFYCPEKRLAIEVDGRIHNTRQQHEYDQERTKYLRASFIECVRFPNDLVLKEIGLVLEQLESFLSHPKAPPKFGRGSDPA